MNIQLTDKKEQIFQSTLQLIHEHGFHGSPMSKIAKEADVAVGSIYHYFPSKDELIVELYWYCLDIIKEKVFLEVEENYAYEYRFRLIWKNLVNFYVENNTIFSFMEQFYSSPFYEGIRLNVLCKKSERKKITRFLEEGIHIKQLKEMNVRLLESAYLGAALFLVRSKLYERSALNDEEVDQLVGIIWNGVKK